MKSQTRTMLDNHQTLLRHLKFGGSLCLGIFLFTSAVFASTQSLFDHKACVTTQIVEIKDGQGCFAALYQASHSGPYSPLKVLEPAAIRPQKPVPETISYWPEQTRRMQRSLRAVGRIPLQANLPRLDSFHRRQREDGVCCSDGHIRPRLPRPHHDKSGPALVASAGMGGVLFYLLSIAAGELKEAREPDQIRRSIVQPATTHFAFSTLPRTNPKPVVLTPRFRIYPEQRTIRPYRLWHRVYASTKAATALGPIDAVGG